MSWKHSEKDLAAMIALDESEEQERRERPPYVGVVVVGSAIVVMTAMGMYGLYLVYTF